MKQRSPERFALLTLLILGVACGGDGPVAPSSPGLTGKWSGTLALRGGLEAGQPVALELVELDGRISGTMTDWEGIAWSIDGDMRLLSATRIPATSSCSTLTFSIEEVKEQSTRPVEFSGSVTGRCYGTAAGTFRLARN